MRFIPAIMVFILTALCAWWALESRTVVSHVLLAIGALLSLTGIFDLLQSQHTLWRNFPLTGRIRWLGEALRPFLRAYIVESETEGRPFDHETRSMVYRRAKDVTSVEPFGSLIDMDKPPYEWLAHSVCAAHPTTTDPRVMVGAPGTAQPYSASVFNISAMSFGALGAKAIESLNRGAALGGF